jgi:benzoyl-CoA reductase subunit B
MAGKVTSKAMDRLCLIRDEYRAMLAHVSQIPVKEAQLQVPLLKAMVEDAERTIRCVEEGEPFIASWGYFAPEIYTAMDLHWNCVLNQSLNVASHTFLRDLEQVDQLVVPRDVCTLVRLIVRAIEAGDIPIPTAAVALLMPCDNQAPLHDMLMQHEDWRNVPIFGIDPPYWEDERAIDYHTREFRHLISFLEKHTNKKLDFERLREVVEESNAQFRLWMEYDDLKRSVPCPHLSFSGAAMYQVAQVLTQTIGHPNGTEYFRAFVADAEERVRSGRGALEKERIRIYWADLAPAPILAELTAWLAEEWGANVIMDSNSNCVYELIDTSSEDSMLRGLAKRALLHPPMVRQSRGQVDTYLDDVVRIVRDYKIDCVIVPAHMGHKDVQAVVGLTNEVCRDLGVPVLHIGLDLFDPRYMPLDEVKNKISEFFQAMRLG